MLPRKFMEEEEDENMTTKEGVWEANRVTQVWQY